MPARVDCEDIAVLAPTGRDASLMCQLLEQKRFKCRPVGTVPELVTTMNDGLGLAIVTEEALGPAAVAMLVAALEAQAAWSDFPFVVMSGHGVLGGGPSHAAGLVALGNVTVLDRPVQTRTLLSAVKAALRARQKQYASRRAIEERDRFLAMLGHELRNPLGAILFATEKLKRDAGASSRLVDTVHRQTQVLSRLVDDLLDVSRVTSGKIVLTREPIDLRELAQRTLATLDAALIARRMRLTRHFDTRPVMVDGDAVRLEQVANNLVVNALKYTPEGGSIEVAAMNTAEGCELRVKDSGIGINPNNLESIFDLFTQVDQTIDRSQGGLGLGLTLVRNLLALHGGTVQAHSAGQNRGSEFVVKLPRSKVERPEVIRALAAVPAPTGLKVVVIEDNTDIREMLEELLVDEGHSVSAAAEGNSGVSLIVRSLPDIALVDIGLPGIDGYQVATAVRQQLGQRIRMVALSGYGQPEDKARALRAGFDAHLTKPIDLDRLHAVMVGS